MSKARVMYVHLIVSDQYRGTVLEFVKLKFTPENIPKKGIDMYT